MGLNEENVEKLAAVRRALPKDKSKPKPRQKSPTRELTDNEFIFANAEQRRRLERQGVHAHPRSPLFPAGSILSVELRGCGHRARVEVLASGKLPARASCPRCQEWSDTKPTTARPPRKLASRVVVSERVEERGGKTYTVKVLATPRRARRSRRTMNEDV